jgi:hypothetical protein
MMSETVMFGSDTDFRNYAQVPIPNCAIYAPLPEPRITGMLTTTEILRELEARNIPKTEIARVAGVGKSRVTELFEAIAHEPKNKPRKLSHDEAVRLVEGFGLEQAPPASPLPVQVCRLLARHVGRKLGVPLPDDDARLTDLTKDLRAFSRFVSDPQVRQSIEAAEGFFRTMEMLHLEDPEEARPGTDPVPNH